MRQTIRTSFLSREQRVRLELLQAVLTDDIPSPWPSKETDMASISQQRTQEASAVSQWKFLLQQAEQLWSC